MSRRLAVFCLVSTMSLASTLSAQESSAPDTATTTAAEAEANAESLSTQTGSTSVPATEEAAAAKVPDAVPQADLRRDPKGVRGISPFWEEVQKGDAAFIARDLVAAQTFYQAAIFKSPQDPQGHLRMAELSLDQGALDEAQTFASAALRFSGENLRAKADASFLLSTIQERLKKSDEALVNWRAYKSLSVQLPPKANGPTKGPLPVRVYSRTADARIAAIETVKKLDAEYDAVRKRIQKGLGEAKKATTGK